MSQIGLKWFEWVEMHWNVLKCVGLGWSGSGPEQVIIDWNEVEWVGLGQNEMEWVGRVGMSLNGYEWVELGWSDLEWVGIGRSGLERDGMSVNIL